MRSAAAAFVDSPGSISHAETAAVGMREFSHSIGLLPTQPGCWPYLLRGAAESSTAELGR